MPRRILIVTNRIPYPLRDGGAIAMNVMVQGYHNAGWQVFLLAMNTSRHYVDKEIQAGLYRDLYAFEAVDTDNRIRLWPVVRNLVFRRTPEHADRFYNPAFHERLQSVLQSFKPDVVQLESIYLNVYRDVFRNNSKALLVQRLHNIEWQIWKRLATETRHPLKCRYLHNLAGRIRRFEEKAWRDADLLLPITAVDDRIIEETGCTTPRHITPFGIDITESLGEGGVAQIPVAGWQGYHLAAMEWRPNQDAMKWFIRDIWPLLHTALPDFRFSFAGRNMPEALKTGLPEGITCAGEVSDAAAFILDKQILIVPLRSGGGVRIKILEAMATGKLVVSTSIGMQGIDAIPGVHFLQADIPEQFTDRIKFIFANPDKATVIAAQGCLFVRTHYDRNEIMTGLLEVIENEQLKV